MTERVLTYPWRVPRSTFGGEEVSVQACLLEHGGRFDLVVWAPNWAHALECGPAVALQAWNELSKDNPALPNPSDEVTAEHGLALWLVRPGYPAENSWQDSFEAYQVTRARAAPLAYRLTPNPGRHDCQLIPLSQAAVANEREQLQCQLKGWPACNL